MTELPNGDTYYLTSFPDDPQDIQWKRHYSGEILFARAYFDAEQQLDEKEKPVPLIIELSRNLPASLRAKLVLNFVGDETIVLNSEKVPEEPFEEHLIYRLFVESTKPDIDRPSYLD